MLLYIDLCVGSFLSCHLKNSFALINHLFQCLKPQRCERAMYKNTDITTCMDSELPET